MTAATMAAMLPVNALGMFVMFTKLLKMFDPGRVKADARHAQRIKKAFY